MLFEDETIGAGEGNLVLKYSINNDKVWGRVPRVEVPMTSGSQLKLGVPGEQVRVWRNEWDKFKPVPISGEEEKVHVPSWGAKHAAKNFQIIASSAIPEAPMIASLGDSPLAAITISSNSAVANYGFGEKAVDLISSGGFEWGRGYPMGINWGVWGVKSKTQSIPKRLVQDLEGFKPYEYYFDTTNYQPQNINYIGKGLNGEPLGGSMSIGSITHTQLVRAVGDGASMAEFFEPSSGSSGFDPYKVNYTIQNTTTATTMNGTSSSNQTGRNTGGGSTTTTGTNTYDLSSTNHSSSNTASWNVSSTVGGKTTIGDPDAAAVTISASTTFGSGGSSTGTQGGGTQSGTVKEVKSEIQTNYTNTMSTVNGINFSQTTGTSATTGSTVEQTVDLSAVKENSDGSYGFGQYTLKPGKKYEIYVSFAQVDVANAITGTYGIQGDIGTLIDSQGNVIDNSSFKAAGEHFNPSTIVHAVRQAQNRAALEIFGPGIGGLGDTSLNGNYIEYKGTSSLSTALGVAGSWSFTQVVTTADASKSSSTSMLSAPSYDLAQAQSHESVGVSLDLRNTSAAGSGVVRVVGTGTEDTAYASDHHSHQFAGFSGSFLYGGSKDDEAILSDQDEGNSLLMKDGDDTVRAFSGQQADLGSGSDRYEVNGGGRHFIKTGNGYDSVVVNDITGFFQIADFDLTRDQLIFGDSVSADSISIVLSADAKDADPFSAYFNIYDGEREVGRVYLEHSLAVSDFYLDSRLTLGHQILNSKGDDLVDDLTNYFEAYRQGKPSFSFPIILLLKIYQVLLRVFMKSVQ